jgi:TraK protein.
MSIRSTRRWVTPLLVTLALSSPALLAAQLVEVRDGTVASVRISGNEPNRLVIRDGRVHKVWGADGKVVLKPDADTGQIYLQPTDGWRTRSFSIFVKDDLGGVYTLVMAPTDMPSETVTLVRPERAKGTDRRKAMAWETSMPYERTVIELIRHMALDSSPEGYSQTDIKREIKLWQEARLVLLSRYTGGKLEGEVYELTNVDGKKMRLDEQEFYRTGVLAVAIDRHELAPGSSTKVFLVVGDGTQ